jgi:hypothetical protein
MTWTIARGSIDLPGGVGEGQVALRGLIGRDSDRGADCDDLVGGVDKGGEGAADVAEVGEEHWVALVQHLEPAEPKEVFRRASPLHRKMLTIPAL